MVFINGVQFGGIGFKFAGRVIHESAKTNSRTVAREALKERRRQLEMAYNGVRKRELPAYL